MNKFLLICFFSMVCQAQNIKVGAPAFFPTVWTAGRELLKTISDGLSNTQKIDEEAQKREAAHKILLAPKKSYRDILLEREKRIKALRGEIVEANQRLKPTGSQSAQELETELLGLIELGLRLEDDGNNDALTIGDQGAPEPLLLQKSAQASQWQVPGMFMAPAKVAPGSPGGGGQGLAQEAAALKAQDLAASCHECKKEFGFTRWKYNCKTCGEVVCNDCSPNEVKTPGYQDPQRICRTCEIKEEARKKVLPEGQRIDELCSEFAKQAQEDHGTRDAVLGAANKALEALGSIVPAPFDSVVSAAQKVVSLAQTAATNTAESQRLADRVARLNMAMMKLAKEGDTPLAQRAAKDLKKVFDDAVKLLQKFQPDASRTFMERVQVTWKQYSSNTAEEFNALHTELTTIITDRAFAVSVEDQNRLRAPTVQEIRENVRQELAQVTEEIKRQGLETGQRLVQIEDGLQQLLDRSYGGAPQRPVVVLDPNVVQVDSTRVLGEGAFGVIRPGLLYNSIPVAVKELAHCSGDMATTLQQEAERLVRVSHPNVVKVYGLLAGKDKKTPCAIVMERLGASLESVSQQQTLSSEQKMKYASDIMAGMGRVHDGRVVHCDLKPANVLLTENRHSAKLIDFGLSQGRSTIIFTDIPRSRGTVQYMAPEVLTGQRLGLSCDVYSFGVVLYELWSGRQAWETYSEDQIRTNVIGGARPADLERMAEENIPLPIAHLIEACWKQKSTDRPTFKDMQVILEIEDFWETNPNRWPGFMQPSGGFLPSPQASPLQRVSTLPTAAQLLGLTCEGLCQVLQGQDIHEDILAWLKEKKYNGRQFVRSGGEWAESLKANKIDKYHVEDFEQVHQRVHAQSQDEAERARVREEATKKAQLEAEKRGAERRVASNIEAQQASLRRETEQRGSLDSEEIRLRQAILQQRTTVGQEVAKQVQLAAQKAKERLEQEKAEATRKVEEDRRKEEARLAALRRPAERTAANVARTTAMTADPLKRAGDWYKGPRESKQVGALEWELGRKDSERMTFGQAQAYVEKRKKDGWRLPTIWELDALYQQKDVLGADSDTYFFWSDTAVVGNVGRHWLVNFADGVVSYNFGSYNRVRLVRGGTG